VDVITKTMKVNRKGKTSLKLRCPASEANGPCSGSVKLKTKKKVKPGRKAKKKKTVPFGSQAFSIEAGETTTLKFTFKAPQRRLVNKVPAARKLLARIAVKDAKGNDATLSATLTAKGPK